MNNPPLTPEKLDALLSRVTAVTTSRDSSRIIWTLPAIGQRIGRGREFVVELARAPGSPIRRHGRQYYAFEDDLLAYLRGT